MKMGECCHGVYRVYSFISMAKVQLFSGKTQDWERKIFDTAEGERREFFEGILVKKRGLIDSAKAW